MMLVAIVDDDTDLAGRMATDVEDAGFDASIIALSAGQTIDFTIGLMMTAGAQAVICDHRLQHRVHVPFDGARLVASLYERKIPAVLVTRFFDQDFDVSIRRERHRIPVLLHRDTADPDEINRAVNTAAQEIANGAPPWRIPYRTVVRVEDVRNEDVRVVDAIIPGWNPDNIVRFPLDLLPENMRPRVALGFRFFAKVNVGALRTEDIFLLDPEFGSEGNDDGD